MSTDEKTTGVPAPLNDALKPAAPAPGLKAPKSKTSLNSASMTFEATRYKRISEQAYELMFQPTWLISMATIGILFSGVLGIGSIYVCSSLTLPSIIWYNALHATIGVAGSIAVYSTYQLINHLEDCVMSLDLEAGRQGGKPVRLSDLGHRTSRRLQPNNRWRGILLWARWSYVFSIWLVSLNFEWTVLITPLGQYGCIPANYIANSVDPTGELTFITGATTFAEIYSYGLPLSDGLIGGWSAWPLAGPMSSFRVEAAGPVYVVQTVCSDITLLPDAQAPPPVTSYLNSSRVLPQVGNTYKWQVNVTYPLTSVVGTNNATFQSCDVSITFGSGLIRTSFVQDEWEMVTGGQIFYLETGGLEFQQQMAKDYTYAQVIAKLQAPLPAYTDMITTTLGLMDTSFNSASLPTQGGTFSNLMQWSTQPDGFYYGEFTFRGVAAVAAATVQFATMQYDSTQSGTCTFYGDEGSGILSVGTPWLILISTVGGVCVFLGLFQILEWAVHHRDHLGSRRVIRSLKNPLRLSYDLRRVWMRKGDPDLGDVSEKEFKAWCDKVKVVYGEFKHKSELEIGELGFGDPKEMIPPRLDRLYRKAT